MASATAPSSLAPARPLNLTINGEARAFAAIANVADLIGALDLDPRKVAIERNLAIVPRSLYGDTALADGDRIEIVHFIGGG
jgi:sulfur carrier protein